MIISPKQYDYKCFGHTYRVQLRQGWYAGDRIGLELIDPHGLPVTKITVNMPDVELEPDEILVKTWSENAELIPFLLNNGIAKDTGKRIPAGWDSVAWVMKFKSLEGEPGEEEKPDKGID